MPLYHISAELPEFSEATSGLVPAHRAYIARMFEEGKLVSYSVAANAQAIWCVVSSDSEQEALEIIAGMPLKQLFLDVQCSPLLFHNATPAQLPAISLN